MPRTFCLRLALILALTLGSAGLASAETPATVTPAQLAQFERGQNAFERGDYAIALTEWRPLAEQGLSGAQFGLGALYFFGLGVPQDYAKAHALFSVASAQGFASADDLRDEAAKQMTAAEIAKARRIANDCAKTGYKRCKF